MNKSVFRKANSIISCDIIKILAAAFILNIPVIILNNINSFSASVVKNTILAFISACSAYFYFMTFSRGSVDLKNTCGLVTATDRTVRVLIILMTVLFVKFLVRIAAYMIAYTPIIGFLGALFLRYSVEYLIYMVWYLYAANPYYPTGYYIKCAIKYVGKNFFRYIAFACLICFAGFIVRLFLRFTMGSVFGALLCTPVDMYINLCIAGRASTIIPDEWYNGTAQL